MPIFCRLNVGLIGLRLGRELDESSEDVVLVEVVVITGGTKERLPIFVHSSQIIDSHVSIDRLTRVTFF